MQRFIILIISLTLLIVSGCTSDAKTAGDHGPLGRQVFLRGTMNGWDTSTPFEFSDNRYLAIFSLPPGTHAFKVGDESWESVDLGADPADSTILLSTAKNLVSRGGDISFTAPSESQYVFFLTLNGEGVASMQIHRAVAVQDQNTQQK